MTEEKNQLGKLVGEIRKEKGIRQLELCQGICSVSMLSRIEQGKKEPDKMLLEALFERLGKTLLYWEKVLNNDDIRLFQLQVEINSFLEEKNLEVVQMLLKKYKNFKGVSNPLHKQYKMFANARLLQLQNKNKEAMEELQRALEITLVNFKENNFELKKYYLCYQEIEVYLAWAELAVQYEKEKGYEALQQLIDYIDTNVENNPEMNRIYTIAVHKLACEKASRGKLEEAWFLCRKGIKIKRQSKNLDKLKPLLRLQMEIENKLGFQKEKNEVKDWYYVIEQLEQYAKHYGEKMEGITNNRYGVYGIGEVFRNLRKNFNMSQEDLMHFSEQENYSIVPETLSRIENGHSNPTKKTCETYLKKFNKEMRFYAAPIQSDDYEAHQLRYELGDKIRVIDVKGAKELLEQLEPKIDLNNKYNKQFIAKEKLIISHIEGKISPKEFREKMIEVLKITIPDYEKIEEENKNYGFLSRNEVGILNNIAASYKDAVDCEKGILLYEKLLRYFEGQYELSGRADYMMLLINYVNMLGSAGKHRKCISEARRGIALNMKAKDAVYMEHFLYEIAWNYKELEKKEELSKEEKLEKTNSIKMAFKVSELFLQEGYIAFLKKENIS